MALKRYLVVALSALALFLLIRSSLILIDINRDSAGQPNSPQNREAQDDTIIAEKEREIAEERTFYLLPPYDDFLDVADAIVETVGRNRLSIASYSLLDQDSRPGIELAVEGSILNLLACLNALETMPYYLDIRRMDAGRKRGGFSATLLIFPARPGESDAAVASRVVLEDDETIDALSVGRKVFGFRVIPTVTTAPETGVEEDSSPIPASWISVIGRYAGGDEGYVYALRDDRTGRIVSMQVGDSWGEWRLVSDEDSFLLLEIEGVRHIVEWRNGG